GLRCAFSGRRSAVHAALLSRIAATGEGVADKEKGRERGPPGPPFATLLDRRVTEPLRGPSGGSGDRAYRSVTSRQDGGFRAWRARTGTAVMSRRAVRSRRVGGVRARSRRVEGACEDGAVPRPLVIDTD